MRFKFDTPTENKNGTDGVLVNISIRPEESGPGRTPIAFRAVECDDTGKQIADADRNVSLVRGDGKEKGEAKDDALILKVQDLVDQIAVLVKSKFG